MSYILEALKKSERERQLGQAPALPALLAEQPERSRSRLPWVIIGLLVAINGGVLGYVFLRDRHGDTAKPTEHRSELPMAASGAGAQPIPPPASTTAAAMPPAPIVPEQQPPAPAQARPSATAAAATPQPAEPVQHPAQASTPMSEQVPPRAPAVVKPKAPSPKQAVEDEEEEERPQYRSASKAPSIKINVLAYSKTPEERFAVIDMTRYITGDRLPNGALLKEIEADGVVLEMDGRAFKVTHH